MQVWNLSDTHSHHSTLIIPKNIDCVIYAGDSTNYYDWMSNQIEFESFLTWFTALPIKHKIIIAGNHDAWATKKYNIDRLKDLGIIYLEHDYYDLEGLLLFGSPYTPTFNRWHFMKSRDKLSRYWEALIPGIDILITHGAPKGILDLSHDRSGALEYCGDGALMKAIIKNTPRYHVFGHIHNSKGCYNSGIYESSTIPTIFMNVSCVEDGRFDKGCISQGQVIIV